MAEACQPMRSLGVLVTAASLGLHGAVALAIWRSGLLPEPSPQHTRMTLSLAAPSLARISTAIDGPAAPALPPAVELPPVSSASAALLGHEIPTSVTAPLSPEDSIETPGAKTRAEATRAPNAASVSGRAASAADVLPSAAGIAPREVLVASGRRTSVTVVAVAPVAGAPAEPPSSPLIETLGSLPSEAVPEKRVAVASVDPVTVATASPTATTEPVPETTVGVEVPAALHTLGPPAVISPVRADEAPIAGVGPDRTSLPAPAVSVAEPRVADPPPTLAPSRARDETVASLAASAVSAERIRGFVDRYDGGPCFFASVASGTWVGAGIESFSSTVDQVMTFHAAFMGQLGLEPDVIGQRVWTTQCQAVEFLRRTRTDRGDGLAVDVDRRTLGGGESLNGVVRGAGGRHVGLFLVSEAGVVSDLGDALTPKRDEQVFTIELSSGQVGGPYPEMLIVTASDTVPAVGMLRPQGTSGGIDGAGTAESSDPSHAVHSVAKLVFVRR